MPYNFNVPDGANNISADLQAMKENFNKLGVLKVNQTGFPPADHGEIALVNERLHIYDGNTGIWKGLNFFGFKNRIINGDFSVWQRGTSVTGISTSGYYTADRWKISLNNGSMDMTKSTINNFNSLKVSVNTVPNLSVGSGNYFVPFWYIFEGQHLYDLAIQGKTITLSFLFKSNVTGIFSVAMRNETGAGSKEVFVTEFNYPTADTPQKVIVQIPLNYSFTALANDNNIGFTIIIAGLGSDFATSNLNVWQAGNSFVSSNAVNWASTTGNYVEIAQVQLEEGETATEFEYVPYEIQLLRCMRYYEVVHVSVRLYTDGNQFPMVPIPYKTIKRVTPTKSIRIVYTSNNIDVVNFSTFYSDGSIYSLVVNIDPTASGFVTWQADVEAYAEL